MNAASVQIVFDLLHTERLDYDSCKRQFALEQIVLLKATTDCQRTMTSIGEAVEFTYTGIAPLNIDLIQPIKQQYNGLGM